MSDFIAPKSSNKLDYIGGFAVSAGFKQEEVCAMFEKDHDDYKIILLKTLTDRLAEAFAEHMHEVVRKELWGYTSDDQIKTNSDLLDVKY